MVVPHSSVHLRSVADELEDIGVLFAVDIESVPFFPGDAICLDHDLGEEKSGYDIAKYIVDRCIDEGKKLPEFASQSANPCLLYTSRCV